ncbi:glutathione S-transferase N-terminal domain-containing protein [uncultured Hydrogenophaga sp.]|uniref:glutathione S-transferase N-terminal domain-containing protein n=1 Tax=uncultured Hydrogenophaga sp. TaxID=199683 RepID=UPI00258407F0|nr:glutathione S-transferase N-terminal domain-containing protein [uncultured Hydrogenophaga sp.]
MGYVLYDLRAADGRSFSPFCWRARMALAHKGIEPNLRKVRFSDIPCIGLGAGTVPVLQHGEAVIGDSWDIALYLDEKLPDAPPLLASDDQRQFARFLHHWVSTQLHFQIFRVIAPDIWDRLDPMDQPRFRETREKRLGGAKLESLRDNQGVTVKELRSGLAPLRAMLERQSFLGGGAPAYIDYIVFGALQWARVVSPVALLEPADAVQCWFERCLDLHGGLGRAETATP